MKGKIALYSKYFQLTTETAVGYARNIAGFFNPGEQLSCSELSDGNINYVFRVESLESQKSVIIKQATGSMRSSTHMELTDERIGFEVRSLRLMDRLVPNSVPKIYRYDEIMKCCVMEDLKDYSVMRQEMLKFCEFPFFAEKISDFLAKLHYFTGVFYLSGADKKNLAKDFVNPELCGITERLVYTESITNYLWRNVVPEGLDEFVQETIYCCKDLHHEFARRKSEFMTISQSLIHGDLHTGSIFINNDGFKAFDSEFAFMGPSGYDIGCIVGNLLFAYIRACVLNGPESFKQWSLDSIREIVNSYRKIFKMLFEKNTQDPTLKCESFIDDYLNSVLECSLANAGIEIIRRTVGKAKVDDITDLPEKLILETFKCSLLLGKEITLSPVDFVQNIGIVRQLVEDYLK